MAVSRKDRSEELYVVTGWACELDGAVGAGPRIVVTEDWIELVEDADKPLSGAVPKVGVDSTPEDVFTILPVNDGLPAAPVLSDRTLLVGIAETLPETDAPKELTADNEVVGIEALAAPTELERAAVVGISDVPRDGTVEAADSVGTALGRVTELTADDAARKLEEDVRLADALAEGTVADGIDAEPVAATGGTVTVTYIVVSIVTTRTESPAGSGSATAVPVDVGAAVVGTETVESWTGVPRMADEATVGTEAEASAVLDEAGISAKTLGTTYLWRVYPETDVAEGLAIARIAISTFSSSVQSSSSPAEGDAVAEGVVEEPMADEAAGGLGATVLLPVRLASTPASCMRCSAFDSVSQVTVTPSALTRGRAAQIEPLLHPRSLHLPPEPHRTNEPLMQP